MDATLFSEAAKDDSTYVAPQVLVDVTHDMRVMKEETLLVVVHLADYCSAKIADSSLYSLVKWSSRWRDEGLF